MLQGKTALITGGTSGIGLATAKLLRQNGAQVAITGRNRTTLEQARETIGQDVVLLQTDVLTRDALQRMAADVQQAFGALDIFFANAGIAYVTPLATTDEAQYDRLMDTNVKSVFFSIQVVEPIMKKGGSIVPSGRRPKEMLTSNLNGFADGRLMSLCRNAGNCKGRLRSFIQILRGCRANPLTGLHQQFVREHEKRTGGQRDKNWPNWYAAYMTAQQARKPAAVE